MIKVNEPFMPKKDEFDQLISTIWENKWVSNNGPLSKLLEERLQDYLDVSSVQYVTNGTSALQLAIKALELKGEVITTPFSFIATTTSIIWENCEPVFVDISPHSLCIDPDKVENAISENTSAILATHVYGVPCNVEKLEIIAKKYNLKVIYDAAHAFGVKYKGKSILSYGDISTLSFHATKIFHTVEGGGIVNNIGGEMDKKIQLLRSFGFQGDNHLLPGINAKNSEFHAAMGLCNLRYISEIIAKRKRLVECYDNILSDNVVRPVIPNETEYNYAYYPIILKNNGQLKKIQNTLLDNSIESRRYFYPSLNKLRYLNNYKSCPISEDITTRILCLPLYYDLEVYMAKNIANIVKEIVME